jgi:3-oxoacyl-[acyl-carrier protein] reductase
MSEGPVHVIVGATGGIGEATARLLAARGDRLVLAARSPERLAALAAQLGAVAVPTDATDTAATEALFDRAVAAYGRVDGVAHAVGSILLKPLHRTTDAELDEVLDLNLRSAFRVARAAARVMQKSGGSVVLVSTGAARIGLPNHEAIAAAKAGVEGLVRSAAATYAARGLRFNAVAPGLVRTPLSERLFRTEAAIQASLALHPLRRLGEPGDVARVIAFLLEPANSWISGQTLGVDGGLAGLK